MLSRTEEYAVRAVIMLARHYGERAVSTNIIASTVGAPRNYLSKTLTALAHRGILTSSRGPGGGFALAVAPDVLTVADIMEVFADAGVAGARCVLRDAPCDVAHPCAAHDRWTSVTLRAREPLFRMTLSQFCDPSEPRATGSPL